ncbi:hypothetical protein SAMN05192540_3970 [Maribacter dokdonensis]|uniref:Uncharacterized protein n=1 Tax=Maribacter dokdonensis TaxID=320912 RepID=A0A1H4V1X9_9FLAO|nr:hypothetical protein [Maribacter dokdonensis]SEC74404.1 hypothetical protein SAMN05192540_3970 [Maribacter dokdonensis]
MNSILKLLEERSLYVHIILFKIYISHNGKIKMPPIGNLRQEVKALFGTSFSKDIYSASKEYLITSGYVEDMFMGLSLMGRNYFENWIRNFESLSEEEREKLNTKLAPKMVDFFGLAGKANTVLDIVSNLLALNDKV